MNLGALVAKLVVKAEADAVAVKNALLKAVQEVDSVILPEAAKLEPMVAQLAGQIVPGGGAVVGIAYGCLEAVAKALDTGSAAAEQNLTNAGLDSALIQSIKGLVPALKAAAAQK